MGRKKSFKKKLSPFSARVLRHQQLTEAVNQLVQAERKGLQSMSKPRQEGKKVAVGQGSIVEEKIGGICEEWKRERGAAGAY